MNLVTCHGYCEKYAADAMASKPTTIETTLRANGPALFSCSVIVRYSLNTFSVNDISRLRIRLSLRDSDTAAPIPLAARELQDVPCQDLLLPGSVLVQRDLGAAMAQEMHDQIALADARYALFSAPQLEGLDGERSSGRLILKVELIRPRAWDTLVQRPDGPPMWYLKEWQVLGTDAKTILKRLGREQES